MAIHRRMGTPTRKPPRDHQEKSAKEQDLVQERERKIVAGIDALLARKSMQMKVPHDSNQRKTRDYSLLKAHSDAEVRLHYLAIYADCLVRIQNRGKHPHNPGNKEARPPRWVLLAEGLGTIELMAWSSRFPPQVTVESPSFMVYMSVLHGLSKESEQDTEDTSIQLHASMNDGATEKSVAAMSSSSSSEPSDQGSIKKSDPSSYRFRLLDRLIMDYDRGNRNGADGYQHANWEEVMRRLSQIPEGTGAGCSSGEQKTLRSTSARWAIATLEKPFWEALLSLDSSNSSAALRSDCPAQSFVLSHLDSRWPETAGYNDPTLFPASRHSQASIEYWNQHHRLKRKRAVYEEYDFRENPTLASDGSSIEIEVQSSTSLPQYDAARAPTTQDTVSPSV